jgi:hypothetical protein
MDTLAPSQPVEQPEATRTGPSDPDDYARRLIAARIPELAEVDLAQAPRPEVDNNDMVPMEVVSRILEVVQGIDHRLAQLEARLGGRSLH